MSKWDNIDEVESALIKSGLFWTKHTTWHYRIPELGLDVWPSRKKTMWRGEIVVWSSMEDLVVWLLAIQEGGGVLPASAKRERPSVGYQGKARRPRHLGDHSPRQTTGEKFDHEEWEAFAKTDQIPF